mgnify:FL=1
MKNKIIFVLFLLSLIKLYHIADQRMDFSFNLLLNSFNKTAGEKSSLGTLAEDYIFIKKTFKEKKILDYKISDYIIEDCPGCSHRIVEFTYPTQFNSNATFLIASNKESVNENCKTISNTKYFNIHECK